MLSQDDGTNELFYSQLGEISGSVALILMGDFRRVQCCSSHFQRKNKKKKKKAPKFYLSWQQPLWYLIKKHFSSISAARGGQRKNIWLIPREECLLASKEEEKAQSFNDFFLHQFLILMTNLGLGSNLQLDDHNWESSDFPLVATKTVSDQLYQLNVHKSLGPDGIQEREKDLCQLLIKTFS